jgi:hypothetical protein
MATLIESSRDREDGLDTEFKRLLNEMQADRTHTVKMHNKCRVYYTEKKRRDLAKKKRAAEKPSESGPSPQKRRSTTTNATPGFDIRRDCFYCARNQVDLTKYSHSVENSLSDVRVLDSLASVNEKIKERNDSWGREVQLRISGYTDLIAPDAKYL